ncbi:MAG: T9SS type A sorting domain-containing protein [Sphingobacteriales bacterium]|nr:MAG: T9SS type A sorting domain-containing protein [Sphingobacteriales bacterium]
MKLFTLKLRAGLILLSILFTSADIFSQSVSLNPSTSQTILAGGQISFTATRSGSFAGSGNYTYTWAVTGTAGATISGSNPQNTNSATNTKTITFPNSGNYTVTVTVKRSTSTATTSVAVTALVPNLYSSSGTDPLKAWNVNIVTGAVVAGPVDVVTPLVNTAGLAKNKITATDPNGSLYYIENSSLNTNNGVVNIYAVKPDGTGNTSVGSIDMNGPANNAGLGFVRLGCDASGYGWVVAGDGSANIYIAKFQGNGVNAISNVNTFNNVTLSVTGGTAADFQNGDLAFTANGTMYILANITNGTTGIYTLNSSINPTSVTKKWTLVDASNNNFSGSVNGVAFTQNGSMHISTSTGLYFIDQATANLTSGTVQCSLVSSITGLTDLASDATPSQSSLPVKLSAFSASLNNDVVTLNWATDFEESFDHFEIERSTNPSAFVKIGSKVSNHFSGRSAYQFEDNLSQSSENVFYYRLKMVDIDGRFEYSKVISLRRDLKSIKSVIISPNPVVNGNAAAKISVAERGTISLSIMDVAGRTILRQTNAVSQGLNSISINNIEKLAPGLYVLKVINGNEITTAKFSVNR